MIKLIQRMLRNKRGNFGVLTSIMIVPIFMAAGLGVDVTNGFAVKAELDNAADTAALAALAGASADSRYRSGDSSKINKAIKQDSREGQRFLKANIADEYGVTLNSLNVNVTTDGLDVVAEVAYVASVKTTLMGLFSNNTMEISNKVKASTRLAEKMNFYMLLDNTPSMGVAASVADIATMVNNTPDKCAFACHAVNDSDNRYNLAKKLGVKMRIDMVRESTQQLMDTAKQEEVFNGQFKVGIYTFGAKAEEIKLTSVSNPSSDFAAQKNMASKVDLMSIPYQGYNNDQQTSFDTILDQMEKVVSADTHVGDDTQKVIFLVSDGVGDSQKPYSCTKRLTGSRCQEPIDTRACAKIKDKGFSIAVLYTTYLPLPTNSWYNSWIAPFQTQIADKMKECATPGLFAEVKPNEDLPQAMITLFRNSTKTPRLIY